MGRLPTAEEDARWNPITGSDLYNGERIAKVEVSCTPRDGKGERVVIARLGSLPPHRDKFDTDSSFRRSKFRQAVIDQFDLGEDAHEFLEQRIIAQADSADSEPAGLWQPSVISIADVAPIQTDWFWPAYVPAGALTGVDGDPGLGKSQFSIDLAARITRGDCMPPQSAPDGTYTPRGALMLNGEDDAARTIRPRLQAAGAVLNRVHVLRSMHSELEADERPVSIPYDLPAIERIIRDRGVAIVVIDPFVAFLDAELSVNNDADVRRCLSRLATVAENTGAAIILIRHLNKKSGLAAVYRGGGSIGITGACRAVYMIGQDPADSDSRIMACIKNNLAPEPPSLRFSIEPYGDTSRIRWGDACDVTAHDCLQASQQPRGGKIERAKAIVVGLLKTGPRAATEIEDAIRAEGISDATFRRAKVALGVKADREGFGADGQWLLSLPDPGAETW